MASAIKNKATSAVPPVEVYSVERKAELLLNDAVDAADYAAAREEVRRLGLDPDTIPHTPHLRDRWIASPRR